tara:strand:+ start:999 stop:1769 length:771 start_codon:yes stop_codon:yes gene_type:complete
MKIIKLFIASISFLVCFIVSTYAATGSAEVYKITMRKVELCTASTSVTNCENAVVLGSGDKVVDIAAVTAGASAASYGDPALLPLGETYTHMRVTIDRKFTIKSGEQLDPSGAASGCVTQAETDAMYGGGTGESGKKYTHKVSVTDDTALSSAAEMDVYLENDSYTLCANANCSATSSNTNDYSSPSSATYQDTHSNDTSDDHMLVYELTSPYTVALIAPTIDISFGTQDAIGAMTVSATRCAIYGNEPQVTIEIK